MTRGALLAIPFKSFTQALADTAVTPFGIGRALAGHAFMGLDLTILSIFGIALLSVSCRSLILEKAGRFPGMARTAVFGKTAV